MLEVGARSKGQASLSTPVEILISVLLAIVDSVGPVKEKILHPIFSVSYTHLTLPTSDLV